MVTEKEAKGKRNITLQSKVSKRSSILSLFSTLLKHYVRLFFFSFYIYFSIASFVKLLFYYLFCIIFQCKISRPIKPV